PVRRSPESRRRPKSATVSAPADNRLGFLGETPAGRVAPAAGALSPSTRSECRKAPRFHGLTTRPGTADRRGRPGASLRSARNRPFLKVLAYPTAMVLL